MDGEVVDNVGWNYLYFYFFIALSYYKCLVIFLYYDHEKYKESAYPLNVSSLKRSVTALTILLPSKTYTDLVSTHIVAFSDLATLLHLARVSSCAIVCVSSFNSRFPPDQIKPLPRVKCIMQFETDAFADLHAHHLRTAVFLRFTIVRVV